MRSAFGIEHGNEVSKAEKGYRDSYLAGINPRSKTEVKEGTSLKRIGLPVVGAVSGRMIGSAVGGAVGARGAGAMAGSIGGAGIGLNRNIRSGDTKSTNKRTGKKAKGKVGWAGSPTFNIY